MKKIIAIAFVCLLIVVTLMSLTACSNEATPDVDNNEVIPLTWKETAEEGGHYGNSLETTEGITFSCSDNYVIGPDGEGQFLFMLKEWTEEALDEDFDWTVEISCNHEIIKAECYSYDDEIIASQELSDSQSITIEQEYSETYCDYVIIFVKGDDGNFYTAKFTRSGL